jgi:lysozyme
MTRVKLASLVLSGAALVGIASHEGFVGKTYLDAIGVPTIGFGTTEGVKPNQTITPERALVRLLADASKMETQLKSCIGDVPMHQHEWDAIVSWTYNVGTGAACKSTLVKKLKAGDYTGACNELSRWTYAGGRQLQGLVTRREQERKLCLGY